MKIKFLDTSLPVPSFMIEAETSEERQILKAFVGFGEFTGQRWALDIFSRNAMLGLGGYTSFSFGWVKDKSKIDL